MLERLLVLSILLSIFGCREQSKKQQVDNSIQRPPNIVYILADDLGYGDISILGQNKFQTPNIDRLAESGMLFTSHYSGSTVCAPSRAVLLSGLHSGHVPIRGNKEVHPEGQQSLPDSIVTVAEMLQQNGYKTGAFGKWGLGAPGAEGDPNKQGFDEFYGYNCQRYAHRYYPPHIWDNDQKIVFEGNGKPGTAHFALNNIHQRALDFMTENANRPFFLYYPSLLPHAELLLPDEIMGDFKFEETPFVDLRDGNNYGDVNFDVMLYCDQERPKATFASMVQLLDRQVGEIVDKLEVLGLRENTVIVFTSDNGPHHEGGADPEFFNSNGGVRGIKRDLYEGGIRAPMMVSWPKKVAKNVTSSHISGFQDVFPTFLDIIDVDNYEGVDGISFLPVLIGENQPEHEYLYWEFDGPSEKRAVEEEHGKPLSPIGTSHNWNCTI